LAEVTAVSDDGIRLRARLDQPSPRPGRDVALLAYARPKVLLRCFEHATALGFGRIVVFRCRRVERSHLSSSALEPRVYAERLLRGLEQSRRTHLPEVVLVPRFRQLVEDRLEELCDPSNRFVAHPEGREEAARAAASDAPLSLVIGPEGGLSEHELDELGARGFRAVRAGRQPLRVEPALSYLTGQLRAARQQAGPLVESE
jgi:RsmE family RNA methyltransferase